MAVLTQYKPRSLNDHIRNGKPWDLDRAVGGVRLLQPYISGEGEMGAWQRGTADAVRFNLDYVLEQKVDTILLLAGDHIYKMDYRPLLRFHEDTDADCTIAVRTVSPHETHRFGMVSADSSGRVSALPGEAAPHPQPAGVHGHLRLQAATCCWTGSPGRARATSTSGATSCRGCSRPACLSMPHRFEGYWMDAGTVQAYWEANMALLAETPALDLYDPVLGDPHPQRAACAGLHRRRMRWSTAACCATAVRSLAVLSAPSSGRAR